MKSASIAITLVILSISATTSITPAVADSATVITLTVVGGALQLGSSSGGEPVVTDQRGTTAGWTLSDTTDNDTRTISLL